MKRGTILAVAAAIALVLSLGFARDIFAKELKMAMRI